MKRWLGNFCIKTAKESTSEYRHGAVLCKAGAVVAHGVNQVRRRLTMEEIKAGAPVKLTVHAEEAAIVQVRHFIQDMGDLDLYVARVDKGDGIRNSKPCPTCEAMIRVSNIKRVFYSTDDGHWDCLKVA